MTTTHTTDKATLAFRCVDISDSDVPALNEMVDSARDITFDTFSRHVDWKPLAAQMGYATERKDDGMRLESDRAVSFHSSTFLGKPVYYMVHSAIEFVFRVQREEHAIHPEDVWGGQETVTLDPPPMPDASPKSEAPRRRARP
jgi:hypothetical protein